MPLPANSGTFFLILALILHWTCPPERASLSSPTQVSLQPELPDFGRYGAQKPKNEKETTMIEKDKECTSAPALMMKAVKMPAGSKATVLRKMLSRLNGAVVELDRSGWVARYRVLCGEDQ